MNHQYIFQCNANESTGFGHLTRCLNIAKAIKKAEGSAIIIFKGDYISFARDLLNTENFIIQNKNRLIDNECSTLIIDDYQINQNDIDFCRSKVKTLIKIDDFNQLDLSKLDLIINFRLNAEQEYYGNPQSCLGLNYFPFKKQLVDIRKKNHLIKKKQFNNIYIFIGGNDNHNSGIKLIHLLDSTIKHKHFFLIDKNCKHKQTSDLKSNTLTYLPLISNIDHYYFNADFFISGGGLSKYEVAFCGIANASISQNEGQAIDTQVLAKAHLTYDLGLTEQLINANVTNSKHLITRLNNILSPKAHTLFYQKSLTLFNENSTSALAGRIIRAKYD